jgi:hypothetical protein
MHIPINSCTISAQEKFPQKENFVKCDWPTQMGTMMFSENFLSVQNFLEWKCSFIVQMQLAIPKLMRGLGTRVKKCPN